MFAGAQCWCASVELFCQAVDKLGEFVAPKHASLSEELLCQSRHRAIVAQGRLFAAGFRSPGSRLSHRPAKPGFRA